MRTPFRRPLELNNYTTCVSFQDRVRRRDYCGYSSHKLHINSIVNHYVVLLNDIIRVIHTHTLYYVRTRRPRLREVSCLKRSVFFFLYTSN